MVEVRLDWFSLPPLERWLRLLEGESKEDAIKKCLGREASSRTKGKPRKKKAEQSAAEYFEENFKAIMRSVPLEGWSCVLSNVPREAIPLTNRELRLATEIGTIWMALRSKKRVSRLESVVPLVQFIEKAWDWKIVTAKPQFIGNEMVFFVEIQATNLKLPPIVPLIVTFVFEKPKSAETAARWTEELRRRLSAVRGGVEIILNIAVGRGEELERFAVAMESERSVLLLNEHKIKEVLTSERYSAKLTEVLRQGLGLRKLNPYNFHKPVEKIEMFYGRENEIRQILDLQSRDFLVVGSRRIGKSSLLKYLERTTKTSGSRRPVFIDCSEVETPSELAERIAIAINPRRRKGITAGMLPQLVGAAWSVGRVPFLILLDEADRLVKFARISGDWSAFSALREISNRAFGQTLVTGFREVYRAWQGLKSPLFNFMSPMYLSVLGEESAARLIKVPMEELGLHFKPLKLIRQIVDASGAHPSILQYFGSELIERLDSTGEREIKPADVQAIRTARGFQEEVLKPFKSDDNITMMEKWLVLRLVKGKEDRFSADSLVDVLEAGEREWLKISELSKALEGLELAGLIRRFEEAEEARDREATEIHYGWTIPFFQTALGRSENVERWESQLRKELASGTG